MTDESRREGPPCPSQSVHRGVGGGQTPDPGPRTTSRKDGRDRETVVYVYFNPIPDPHRVQRSLLPRGPHDHRLGRRRDRVTASGNPASIPGPGGPVVSRGTRPSTSTSSGDATRGVYVAT